MVFDPVKHEINKSKFLRTIYEMALEARGEGASKHQIIGFGTTDRAIGERAGFNPQESERIASDLSEEGLLLFGGNTWNQGTNYSLSLDGLKKAETIKYENSNLNTARNAKTWAWKIGAAGLGVVVSIIAYLATMTEMPLWMKWIVKKTGW